MLYIEDYPGQAYFHQHNPAIKKAEENFILRLDAVQVAFLQGQKYLERMVVCQRMELELQKATTQAHMEIEKARMAQSQPHTDQPGPPSEESLWRARCAFPNLFRCSRKYLAARNL